jgi:aryl-alcohol dehydrogenase-like predicted oxidoreductase
MELRPLGRTGVRVSALCLGAMMFGEWGTKDHDQSIRIIHRAFDAGINFIDTADVYSAGESEEIVGKAIAGRRDDIVLATKVHMPMGDDPNRRGNSRRWIIAEVENSLRRLGTDWIDIYQVHRYDPAVDLEVTLGALTDLVRAGKIRYFGHSTSAIIGPRTMDHLETQLPAAEVRLSEDVLDAIDRIVAPGVTLNPADDGWVSPALEPAARRR